MQKQKQSGLPNLGLVPLLESPHVHNIQSEIGLMYVITLQGKTKVCQFGYISSNVITQYNI